MIKRRKLILFSFFLIVLITVWASADQKPPWRGTIARDGEVVVVRNPKEPLYSKPILTLKEDFSIGGSQAKNEYILANTRSLAVDKKGKLFILDSKESHIKVFDDTGKYVRTIGRRGQGPGEIGGALSISIPQNSSELALYDIGNRKLTFFSLDGKFLRSIPLRGMIAEIKTDSQGNVCVSATEFGPGQRTDTLKKISGDMSRVLAEIVGRPEEKSRNPFSPREYWVVDAKDRLIYGEGKAYEIRYYDLAGKLIRRILRNGDPLKVTQKDIDDFGDRQIPGSTTRITYNYSSYHGAYRSFFADDLGHLFVQTWEITPDRRQDIHDIFDAEGRFIGRVALNRHSDLINPKVRIVRSGKYYAIEPDAEGYEVVKRYSLTWNLDR